MIKNKKAKLHRGMLTSVIITLVVISVLYTFLGEFIPDVQEQGEQFNITNQCLNAGCYYNGSTSTCQQYSNGTITGCTVDIKAVPLAGFFSSGGILVTIIMLGIFLLVVLSVISKKSLGK